MLQQRELKAINLLIEEINKRGLKLKISEEEQNLSDLEVYTKDFSQNFGKS